MSSKSVLVIGGGLAGLSSAVALAEAGFRVRLVEKRPHLGGRATSYSLPNGEHVDNCQHVTLGCCTNLDDFYRRAGAAGKIRWYDRLVFVDPSGRRGAIEGSAWPPPLHLGGAFAMFPLLSMADKRGIARAMLAIVRSGGRPIGLEGTGISMLEWLRRERQTETAIERFWKVVLVSALNEDLGRTDARYGVDVFWKAFLANRRGYRVGIPCVPLGELYDGCRGAIEQRGGEVEFRAGVREIRIADGRVTGVLLENGKVAIADFYLAAVPHDVLPALLPPAVVEREAAFTNLRNLRTSPITGVHMWFDRPVMSEPFLTVLEQTTQWIFNKSKLYAEDESAVGQGTQYLQLVISASYSLVARSRQEIIDLCRRELAQVLPATRDAQLVKATVIKEVDATFSPEPGCDRWRPGAVSPVKGLFLAGDWTATGWPATMEGAVRSGYLAAEAILAETGEPRKFLQPDLPVAALNRWLARTVVAT
jgi:zeta-carotene desaturase